MKLDALWMTISSKGAHVDEYDAVRKEEAHLQRLGSAVITEVARKPGRRIILLRIPV